MAYIINTSLEERYLPKAYFEDKPEAWSRPWSPAPGQVFAYVRTRVGFPLSPDLLPSKVVIGKKWKVLPDFFSIQGNIGVSDKFKNIIESFEPHTHQFAPLQVSRQDGQAVAGTYFMFVICTLLDTAINAEMSTVIRVPADENAVAWRFETYMGRKIVLNKAVIGNRHAWIDRRYRQIFFSDDLVTALDAAKIKGLKDRQYCEEC